MMTMDAKHGHSISTITTIMEKNDMATVMRMDTTRTIATVGMIKYCLAIPSALHYN